MRLTSMTLAAGTMIVAGMAASAQAPADDLVPHRQWGCSITAVWCSQATRQGCAPGSRPAAASGEVVRRAGLPRWTAGQAFMASNTAGSYALVSSDDGACQVIAMAGDANDVEHMLLASLKQAGMTAMPLGQKSTSQRGAMQKLFKATLGSRHWTVFLTTHIHSDALNLPPELHLLATAD